VHEVWPPKNIDKESATQTTNIESLSTLENEESSVNQQPISLNEMKEGLEENILSQSTKNATPQIEEISKAKV
jgi:hypothetical protein